MRSPRSSRSWDCDSVSARSPDAAQRAALAAWCAAGPGPNSPTACGSRFCTAALRAAVRPGHGGPRMNQPLLAIRSLRAAYGKIEALKSVDLDINRGEIVALIVAKPRARSGHILFDGRDITDVPTHQIARLRIAQAPEGRRIFPRMSVAENLQMGADATECSEAERSAGLERVFALFPRLRERMTQRGGTLSGGEQQMLAIGRALMSRPRLLMLDEPSLGLAPLIARQIFDAIRTLNRQDGLTVLIVEQNANHALRLAHRGYVMVNGLITLQGTGAELLQRPEIRAAYLEGGRRA